MTITNTSNTLPGVFVLLLSGTGYIEDQQARGQSEAVQSTSLPTDIQGRTEWEALGVVFGEPDPNNPVFCSAAMPEGWTKRATDHAMYNDIVDAVGNCRGTFFYKAAFYDRSAVLHAPLTRYTCRRGERGEQDYYEGAKHVKVVVHDAVEKAVVFEAYEVVTAEAPNDGNTETHRAWWDKHTAVEARMFEKCRVWADQNFPGWKDPSLYWPT